MIDSAGPGILLHSSAILVSDPFREWSRKPAAMKAVILPIITAMRSCKHVKGEGRIEMGKKHKFSDNLFK